MSTGISLDELDGVIGDFRFHRPPSVEIEFRPLFDEKEKATILYAERVTRGAAPIRGGTLEELRKFYDEGQIVELTLVICAANFTNRFNDALRNIPDLGV